MTGTQLRHFVDPVRCANRVLSPHTLEHDRDCYYSIVASWSEYTTPFQEAAGDAPTMPYVSAQHSRL
jgi:hypothetical protein